MKVSIVIPTHQRRHLLVRTLPTVLAQRFDPEQYEVIVVVDGSTDGTIEFLRGLTPPKCKFQVIEQDNQGIACARNAGLRAAIGEVVLFLDDDMICHEELVQRHFETYKSSGRCLVSGPILPLEEPLSVAARVNAKHLLHLAQLVNSADHVQGRPTACGPNDSAPRLSLLGVGGFDESFETHEDIELGVRLWKSGLCKHYQPKAIAYHIYDKSSSDLMQDARKSGRDELMLCRAHPEYQVFSTFSGLFNGPWLRRNSKKMFARMPASIDVPLRMIFAVSETLGSVPVMRELATRLLIVRSTAAGLRSAVTEAGSWRAFSEEVESVLQHHLPSSAGQRE